MERDIDRSCAGRAVSENHPWIMFALLIAIFFGMHHNLFYSAGDYELRVSQWETVAKNVQEGTLSRRLSLAAMAVISVLAMLKPHKNKVQIRSNLAWLLIGFLCWAFLSLAWADDFMLSARRLPTLLVICFGALSLVRLFSVRSWVMFVFVATSTYLIVGVALESFFGVFKPFEMDYRFSGTLGENLQAINCALLVLSSAVLAGEKAGAKNRLFVVGGVIGFGFLIFTKSRTSFASVLIVLCLYYNIIARRNRKITLLMLMMTAVIFCILILMVGDDLFPQLSHMALMGRGSEGSDTLTGRIPLWAECLKYFQRKPFFGYGYGSFWTGDRIVKVSDSVGWAAGEAHSAYLELLLNLGLIGALFYVALLLLATKRSLAISKSSPRTCFTFFSLLLVFCLLNGLLESAAVAPTLLMFLSFVALCNLAFVSATPRN